MADVPVKKLQQHRQRIFWPLQFLCTERLLRANISRGIAQFWPFSEYMDEVNSSTFSITREGTANGFNMIV